MAQRGPAAGVELGKVLVEVGGHSAEHRLVSRILFLAEPGDQVFEVGPRGGDVLELLGEVPIALLELAALRLGEGVGRPDLLQPALEGAHLALARLAAGNLFGRDPVGHARADLLHPRLQELRLADHQLEVAVEVALAKAGVDARLLEGHQLARGLGHLGLVLGGVALGGGQRLPCIGGGFAQWGHGLDRELRSPLGLVALELAVFAGGRQPRDVFVDEGVLAAQGAEPCAPELALLAGGALLGELAQAVFEIAVEGGRALL